VASLILACYSQLTMALTPKHLGAVVEFVVSSAPTEREDVHDAAKTATDSPRSNWQSLDRIFQHPAVEVLRHRDFRLLWFGHVFASMGFWMDQVTRGWLIY
jgi:hypothetical protein